MSYALLLSLHVTIFLASACACVWLMARRTPASRRVAHVARLLPPDLHEPRGARRLEARVLKLIGVVRSHFGGAPNPKLQKRLQAAGLRDANSINAYVGARILGPLGVLVAWTFFQEVPFFYASLGLAATYLAPDMWLSARIKKRREQIRLGLADAIDLLVICVDAGLGLDQALLRTGQELGATHPALSEELLQINLEQRAGKPRVNAWRDMADRTEVETVKGFASMLAQSDRFGTPVAKALSTFSDTLRMQRSQQAEEMAAKTTIKLMFPLVLFIFPSMFIVLLGPAALTISRSLGALSGK